LQSRVAAKFFDLRLVADLDTRGFEAAIGVESNDVFASRTKAIGPCLPVTFLTVYANISAMS
jgi:hypothetical protein